LAAEHDSVALRLPACLPARDARRTRDCHGVTPLPPRPSRFNAPVQRADDGPRINGDITAFELLVIDSAGEKRGVMSRRDALRLAEEEGFDLVEVAPQATPPVCKIMDYGKFKFQEQKKAAEARRNQKTVEVKEIKLRPGIDKHDYEVKMKAMKAFFEEGDKVKVTLRFRGREMAHQDLGMKVLDKVKIDTAEIAKVESEPNFEGRQVVMVLAPK